MSNILLTGGRAPATLELARLLKQAGHRVIVADSLPHTLCSRSRAVEKSVLLPPPRQKFSSFVDALVGLVQRERIELLIPTCEELFYVAMARPQLEPFCELFLPTIEELRLWHSKITFVEKAAAFGLMVPETVRVTDRASLLDLSKDRRRFPHGIVVKPEFSRFATKTLILPTEAELRKCLPSLERAWAVQAFVPGNHFSTYSVVQDGQIVAHSDYSIRFTAGSGAAVAFEPLNHAGGFEWVAHFAGCSAASGQLAFDFIEQEGVVWGIECNPRLTSGIHLFYDQPDVTAAFLSENTSKAHLGPLIQPDPSSMAALPLPLWVNGPSSIAKGNGMAWVRGIWRSRNIIFEWSDPAPWLGQWRSIVAIAQLARKHRCGLIEATTADIEWNGETIV